MANRTKDLGVAKQEFDTSLNKTIELIDYLGTASTCLYESLNSIQDVFDKIRGIPDENKIHYQSIIEMRKAWKKQVDDIQDETKKGTKNTTPEINNIEIGVTTIAVSPSLAAGLATCFETLTLGLLAPSLGGIPTLAAAIAIGAAPIIEPVSAIIACIFLLKVQSDIDCANNIFARICEKNTKAYERSMVEITERIARIHSENNKLIHGVERLKGFGINYKKMTAEQKFELGTYMNLMLSATQLIVRPIDGLQPYYSDRDFDNYILSLNDLIDKKDDEYLLSSDLKQNTNQHLSEKDLNLLERTSILKKKKYAIENKTLLMYLCNLLHGIHLNLREKKVLCKCLAGNSEFLNRFSLKAEDINESIIDTSINMLLVR